MADEKLTPEQQAEKDRKAALEEQDNPPEPYPSQEQLNKIQAGEPLDEDDDEAPAPKKPEQPQPSPAPTKTAEPTKPASGYQTR
jgi:hypothetical protein